MLCCALLALQSGPGQATTFISFDARTMAMGGAGVATGRPANAALFNPSLLAQTSDNDLEGAFAHLFAGARLIDRDDFLDRVDQLQENNPEDALDDLLLSARSAFQSGQLNSGQLRQVAQSGDELLTAIEDLSNRPVRAAAAGGFSFGYADTGWGVGLFVRRYTILGGQFELAEIDVARMRQLIAVTRAAANVINSSDNDDGLNAALGVARIETLVSQSVQMGSLSPELLEYEDIPGVANLINAYETDDASLQVLIDFIDVEALELALAAQNQGLPLDQLGLGDVDLRDYLRYQAAETFESAVVVSGAEIQETALSGAWQLMPDRLSLGINFKVLDITLIDFSAPVTEVEFKDFKLAENRREFRKANIDLGVDWRLNERWNVGAVIRNAIPFALTSPLGAERNFNPIARVGLGYRRQQVNVGLDIDLTANEPLGFDPDKQYIGMGIEVFLWPQTALRAGYRVNRIDRTRLPSLGLGLGFDSGHLDIAIARSEQFDEYGLSVELGVHF